MFFFDFQGVDIDHKIESAEGNQREGVIRFFAERYVGILIIGLRILDDIFDVPEFVARRVDAEDVVFHERPIGGFQQDHRTIIEIDADVNRYPAISSCHIVQLS
jgi:hypothetical protein